MIYRVFLSATGLLALLEIFAGVGQVDTLRGWGLIVQFFLSFFSQASTIMAEAITIIQARTGWIFPGVLHSCIPYSKNQMGSAVIYKYS